jgi:uncharacterized membrane protein YqjE
MADLHVTPPGRDDGRTMEAGSSEPALGDLFRQLAQDSATLVRQEMALAKAELKTNVKSVARDAVMVGVGGILALIGAMVLLAAVVVAVGDALDNYWLGALIVAALFLIVGGLLAMSNLKKLKQEEVAPTRTLETLKEDKQWLQSEIKQARRDLA